MVNSINCVRKPDKIPHETFKQLSSCLCKQRRKSIYSYINESDSQRSLIAGVLSRLMLCEELKVKNRSLVFYFDENGKPHVDSCFPIHFNISHSGDWIACATADVPIGIDIEVINSIDLEIAQRFFTDAEYKYLVEKKEESVGRFFEIWTLKESYLKTLGTGLSKSLKSFNISFDEKIPKVYDPEIKKPFYVSPS